MSEEDIHDEVEIEDFEWDEDKEEFRYPCPCGDMFVISKEDLLNGDDIAKCPACSLQVRVIYDVDDVDKYFQAAKKGELPTALATS